MKKRKLKLLLLEKTAVIDYFDSQCNLIQSELDICSRERETVLTRLNTVQSQNFDLRTTLEAISLNYSSLQSAFKSLIYFAFAWFLLALGSIVFIVIN